MVGKTAYLIQGVLDADIVDNLALAVPQSRHKYVVPKNRSIRFILPKIHRSIRPLMDERVGGFPFVRRLGGLSTAHDI